mgnify:CR=1 FL=1
MCLYVKTTYFHRSQLVVGLVKAASTPTSIEPFNHLTATPSQSTRPFRLSAFPEVVENSSHHSDSTHPHTDR